MTILRNILALVMGVVLGGIVNMLIVTYGAQFVPPPAGVDVSNPESIAASMHLYGPKDFVVPFLAHALGTFVGALIAYFVAASHRVVAAYAIAAVFLAGGIVASFMIPAPLWFILLDLVLAYLPMAWFATYLARR